MKVRLFLYALLWPFAAECQVALTLSECLIPAKDHPSVRVENRKLNYLRNNSHTFPLVDEIEFRTETHEFDPDLQEYLLRISPNTLGQRKAQKAFHNTNIQYNVVNQQLQLADMLKTRYEALVEWMYYHDMLPVYQQLSAIYQDKIAVLRREAETTDFDISDLIQAEEKLHETEIEIFEMREAQKTKARLIAGADSIDVESLSLIEIPRLVSIVKNGSADTVNNHLLLDRRRIRVNLAQHEYELERAETRRIFDFVQARYQNRENRIFNEEFTIGLGFRLPLKSDSKLDLHELQLTRIEEENSFELLQAELTEETQQQAQLIQRIISRHDLEKSQWENSQAAFSLEQFSRMDGVSPLTLLKLNESKLKKELILQRLRRNIFLSYVDWLDVSGQMMQMPLRNYLSREMDLL